MMRRMVLGVFVLGLVIAAFGCTREPAMPRNALSTAEETVKAYCDLDANGARLTSVTWSKVLPYISWPEEAGFDRAVIIAGYSLGPVQKKNDKEQIVPVAYQVLGAVAGDYAPGRKTETIRFRVARTDRGWKIMEPDFLPPHVLAPVMVKHLQETKQIETADKVKNDS